MKIENIEIDHYVLPLNPPFKAAWDPKPRENLPFTIVKIHTDEGITGIGSGDMMVGFAGHENLFIGHDPFDYERHWQVLDNIDFHYGRPWVFDLALWDLMGKATGLPVYKLLGAGKSKIRAYASNGELVSATERADRAEQFIELGFKAMKIRFHHQDPKDDIKIIETVRKQVGNEIEIMVDANQGWYMPWDATPRWQLKEALTIAHELEQLNVYWLEEPLPHYDIHGMATLRKKTGLRIAGSEMNRRWHEYQQLADAGALDVYQPDVALCGGITGVKRIADYVQSRGAVFTPHTWTNGIGVMANLHLSLAVSKADYLEYPYDPPAWGPERNEFMILPEDRLKIDSEGYLHPPEKPGLGFSLNEKEIAPYKVKQEYLGW